MAKKVVVSDDEKKPKKKRGKCCGCCVAVLIVVLIILAAAFGVGWYFGDRLTREYLNMSLADTFGVLGDMYWANDEKIVKNPYTAADREGFYKEIKRNVMLKDDAEIDFDGALDKAVQKFMESAQNGGSFMSARALNDDRDGETESDSDIMKIFSDMIADVLHRDNIDINRLMAYDENDPSTDSYKLNIRDRELAAFLGAAVDAALKHAGELDDLKEISERIDLSSVASLKQISFVVTDKDGDEVKASRVDVTLWVGLQDAAGQLLESVLAEQGMSWAGSLAKGLANMLLPKNLYVNAGIPLYGDADPVVSFNNMSESQRERAYRLVNGVLALTADGGETQTVDEILDGVVESIKPTLEQAAEKIDFNSVDSGVLTVDLLDVVAKAASESLKDPLTKADFIYLLQALFSDPDTQLDRLEPYRYTNRYVVDGKDVYIKGGDSSKTPVDYEQEFINEIEEKYALKFKPGAKLTDVLAMLGVSLDGNDSGELGSTDLLDMIDAQKFNALLSRDIRDIKLNVTDRMLASALSGQMNGLLTGVGSDFAGATVTLDALTFVKNANKPNRQYALIAVEADLSGLVGSLGDGELMTRIAAGLMPERLVLTVTVDITRNRVAGETADPAQFTLNSCENTDRALSVLEKLSPSFDLGAMSNRIDEMLNGMLDQMYKALDVQLIASEAVKTDDGWKGDTGSLVLPDIFTFVASNVLVKDDGEYVVTPDELKTVLRELNAAPSVQANVADGYGEFISDVVDKYYLDVSNDGINTFEELTAFMGDFDTGKFRMCGDDPDIKYLAYDTRGTSELQPIMTGGQLGALIKEQMGDGVKDYTVKRVATGDDSLTVVLSIGVGDLLPEDVKFLVTTDELIVTAAVDMSAVVGDGVAVPYRYDVSVKLNDMDADTYNAAVEIIRFFTPDFDIAAQVNEFGEILYTQMQRINDSFTPSVDIGVDVPDNNGVNFFRFTEQGLVMNDFYTFLANKMNLKLEGGTTADTVKSAVQGMYERSSVTELINPDNYVKSEVITNPGDKDWADGEYPQSGKAYSDKAFNAYLAKGIEGLNESSVKTLQTVALSAADIANNRSVRAWLSERLDNALVDTSDYLAVTVGMDMGDFMSSDNSKAGGFLPSAVVATIVYKYDSGEFTEAGIILNGMKHKEYTVLQQLMGLYPDSSDDGKVNIVTVGDATAGVLNALTAAMNVQIVPQLGEGVGGITATLRNG